MNRLEIFIKVAKLTHGDLYDYSKVEYKSATEKVIIICKKHGEFYQTPNRHANLRYGCCKCKINNKETYKFKPIERFIIKSNLIYNNLYDYSKVDYINATTDIIIICKIHGEFSQTPYRHTNTRYGFPRYGCPKCNIHTKNKFKKFITNSVLKYKNVYDYSKVDYINSKTKVKIICKEHGEFQQTPYDHIYKHGCLLCKLNSIKYKNIKQEIKYSIYNCKGEKIIIT